MEDVKWLLRKFGIGLFILLVVIVCGLYWRQAQSKNEKYTQEVWEPPIEIASNRAETENIEETTEKATESSLWLFPQVSECFFTETEMEQLKNTALEAATQVKDVYKDIEIVDGPSYSSNIVEFTEEQRKEVTILLGKAGFTSVTEDYGMENSENLKDFYNAYTNKQEAMCTIVEVHRDGLISAITFLYRNNELQTYYVGIGWQENGMPELRDTLVSDVEDVKLTEKGYFIYGYEIVIAHASLRQYWRIEPLSSECRELTEKYISGLSYVNYNVLVENWDSSNVEDILMPCMFEDIYRIYTGENLRVEGDRIPADMYEKIMTTYFPVSVEQIRKLCGYDESSNSYQYEMIYASPYPPFGEVIDYTWNGDGTITLIVDGVWADYNSDCAFTNTIVIQPFEDGTFRYLSNRIEQKELELPPIAKIVE